MENLELGQWVFLRAPFTVLNVWIIEVRRDNCWWWRISRTVRFTVTCNSHPTLGFQAPSEKVFEPYIIIYHHISSYNPYRFYRFYPHSIPINNWLLGWADLIILITSAGRIEPRAGDAECQLGTNGRPDSGWSWCVKRGLKHGDVSNEKNG